MADDTAPRQPTDRPSERTWVVPVLFSNERGEDLPDVNQAHMAVQEAAVILMRLGGSVSVVAKRVKLDPQGPYAERYETEFLVFRHQSFSPVMAKATATPAPTVELGGSAGDSAE